MSIAFITRIREDDDGKSCVEAFIMTKTNPTPREVNNPQNWRCLFMGTKEEAYKYTINLHHGITPEMAGDFSPSNVKRVIEQ